MQRLLLIATVLTLSFFGTLNAGVHIVGYARDAATREPVPMVSVALLGTEVVVMGNEQGGFTIDTDVDAAVLRFTAVGYHPKEVTINPGQTVLVVDMSTASVELSEVEVNRTREKYSKKNNPAVELMQRIRSTMHEHDPMRSDFYSFDKYQRVVYGFNDFDELAMKNKVFRRFSFLGEYADTSRVTGKRVLPISVREQTSTVFHRRDPQSLKEVVTGMRNGGIDEPLDQSGVKTYLEDVFREVDIFQNDVTLLLNRFVSPLSVIGADFYKYYLSDTLLVDGERCIELSFVPHTPETFGFTGRLYVAMADNMPFVKKVKMSVPASINLNYVERLTIEQDFVKAPDGTRLKTCDDVEVEFRLMKGTPGFYARRETAYASHNLQQPSNLEVFNNKKDQIVLPEAEHLPDEYWSASRPRSMHTDGGSVRQMLSRLRQSKFFKWAENVAVAFVKGYVPTGNPSKWDFGPINTTISGNPLEGLRLRLGGMTTTALNPHWFARGYVAYGFRDQKWKYMAQLEYSFVPKRQFDQEFPIHSIRLMHKYDVDHLGQHYLYTNPDNVFLALKRKRDDKTTYLRHTELLWRHEWANHLSVAFGLEHMVHEASSLMPFLLNDGSPLKRYTQAGFHAQVRWAPGEKFFQTRSHRIPINMDAPIITISHTWHPKGWLGSRHQLNRTEIAVQKRFWFSAFGHADIMVDAAKIWNQVSFPELLIPNVNLSYTIQPGSYALMNPLEFISDQTLSGEITYWGGGALLNRVPLIKHLKLREVLSVRALWGSLSKRNNPENGGDVLAFPENTLCQSLSHEPYVEASVGLDNILSILRVDYVWRLTHRHNPGASRGGVRVALHFAF